MTDKNLADSKSEITIDRDPFLDLWSKAKLISVGGPLHRFVPKEPGWCQVLGNKLDRLVMKKLSLEPRDEGPARGLAVLEKHRKQLDYVFSIAWARREDHLARRRLRRQRAEFASNKPELTIIDGGRP